MSAGGSLQAALAEALQALEVTGVFDGPPARAPFPYVVLDAGTESDWSHKSGSGREVLVAVTVWDDQPARLHQLADAAEAAVAGTRIVEGWELASLACVTYAIPPGDVPRDYRLRGGDRSRLYGCIDRFFSSVRAEDATAGDLLVCAVAEDQLHLAILTQRGVLHADARLRRVVETPGEVPERREDKLRRPSCSLGAQKPRRLGMAGWHRRAPRRECRTLSGAGGELAWFVERRDEYAERDIYRVATVHRSGLARPPSP